MAHRHAPSNRPPAAAGIHIGRVTRVDSAGAYVELKRVADGFEFGPAPYPAGSDLTAGDRVAVGFLEDSSDDLVVLTVLTS